MKKKSILGLSYFSKTYITVFALASASFSYAQKVDYSVVNVPEETGLEFRKITSESDYVCMPEVRRNNKFDWFSNRIIALVPGGQEISYLSARNNTTNIFVKDLNKMGGSRQRTNRTGVIDFAYSPDGKSLYFSEKRGNTTQLFRTDAENGYACRQITSGAQDFSPTPTGDKIFFARQEANGCSIWSFSLKDNFLSSYSSGLNPTAIPKKSAIIVARPSTMGKSELWKIDYSTGIEECLVSDPDRSFTTPSVSPDGEHIVFVGSSTIQGPNFRYPNTDIFVCNIDGTDLRQLTYHAADDLSPIWSSDGNYIYFVSQRGSSDGSANIWRMNFEK